MEEDVLSLRDHLMNWLLTPLFVLWLFSTVAGYVATLNYANQPYDLALLERAQSVATPTAAGKRPGTLRCQACPAGWQRPRRAEPGVFRRQ